MKQLAPRNHEQRLEHIMKKAVMQEQVWGVGLDQNDEWRVGLAPGPKDLPVAPRKWSVG